MYKFDFEYIIFESLFFTAAWYDCLCYFSSYKNPTRTKWKVVNNDFNIKEKGFDGPNTQPSQQEQNGK